MITVKDIYDLIDNFAPFSSQMEWDNAGLIIGNMDKKVTKIGIALDATNQVITDAVNMGCDLLVTHHPVIFNPLSKVDFDSPVSLALKNDLSVICAHTNLDVAENGVNRALLNKLELSEIENISNGDLILFTGKVPSMTPDEFAKYISMKLNTTVSYADAKNNITNIAVCGGAAGEYLYDAKKLGMDAFVTGEVHHHEYLDAVRLGISVFCAGHFETENPCVETLKELLKKQKEAEVVIINQNTPVKYITEK